MKKRNPNSISSLDKKLWTEFSKFIRTRDCLKTTGVPDEGICITCEQRVPFKKLQAGHFIPRQYKTTRYDEKNNHAQCFACNMFMGGNVAIYGEKIKDLYGEEERQRLIASQYSDMKGGYIKKTLEWYKEKKEEYIKRTKELKQDTLSDMKLDDLALL